MRTDTVDSRARERFGMTEREYLSDRIRQGWSVRRIARELGFSAPAVRARVLKIARMGHPWVLTEEAA